jgi:GcrA cell cycle regulator
MQSTLPPARKSMRPMKSAGGLRAVKITTSTLSHRTCKWPIGDPAKVDFHYCGKLPESGQIYCGPHYDMGYQTTPKRKNRTSK